jgi:hypothetical protein
MGGSDFDFPANAAGVKKPAGTLAEFNKKLNFLRF